MSAHHPATIHVARRVVFPFRTLVAGVTSGLLLAVSVASPVMITDAAVPIPPRIVLVLDDDGDGLTDNEERALGTDPTRRDTDRDALNDAMEIGVLGTDPLNADTDGDGLADGKEVLRYGSDPLTADRELVMQVPASGTETPSLCDGPLAVGPFSPTMAHRFEIRCGIEYA